MTFKQVIIRDKKKNYSKCSLSIRLQHHISDASGFFLSSSFISRVSHPCVVATLHTYILISLFSMLRCSFFLRKNFCFLLKAIFANAKRCFSSRGFLPLDVILLETGRE